MSDDIDEMMRELEERTKAHLKDMREKYGALVNEAIAKAKAERQQADIEAADGAQVYAYIVKGGFTAWGVNEAKTGRNIWRGLRSADGTDKAEN